MFILVFDSDELGLRFMLKSLRSDLEITGSVTDIATEAATLRLNPGDGREAVEIAEINDVSEAVCWVRDLLLERSYLPKVEDLRAVAQYVLHGGQKFKVPAVITDDVVEAIERLRDNAPAALDINLQAINAVRKFFPSIRQIAVFDTAFHHTIPDFAALYAIPLDYIKKYNIRRYGFHGIPHRFMMNRVIEAAGLERNRSRVITIELSYGCSANACRNGISVDNSMGFSRLEGLAMPERAGTVNFDVLSFLHSKENMSIEEISTMLNKFSGLYGLSGGLHSMEEILSAVEKGDVIATNAYKNFIYQVRKHIGAYMLLLGGVDAIAISGILVQDLPQVRESIFEDLSNFGMILDTSENARRIGENEGLISAASSAVKIYYFKRNTQRAIFQEVEKLL